MKMYTFAIVERAACVNSEYQRRLAFNWLNIWDTILHLCISCGYIIIFIYNTLEHIHICIFSLLFWQCAKLGTRKICFPISSRLKNESCFDSN